MLPYGRLKRVIQDTYTPDPHFQRIYSSNTALEISFAVQHLITTSYDEQQQISQPRSRNFHLPDIFNFLNLNLSHNPTFHCFRPVSVSLNPISAVSLIFERNGQEDLTSRAGLIFLMENDRALTYSVGVTVYVGSPLRFIGSRLLISVRRSVPTPITRVDQGGSFLSHDKSETVNVPARRISFIARPITYLPVAKVDQPRACDALLTAFIRTWVQSPPVKYVMRAWCGVVWCFLALCMILESQVSEREIRKSGASNIGDGIWWT